MFGNPLQGAATIVVAAPKDTVVPFAEVCFFLVEEVKFGGKEASEMVEHESGGRLSRGG